MSEVEALKKVLRGLVAQRDRAANIAGGWNAWGMLNCKIADLELALLIREPEEKGSHD